MATHTMTTTGHHGALSRNFLSIPKITPKSALWPLALISLPFSTDHRAHRALPILGLETKYGIRRKNALCALCSVVAAEEQSTCLKMKIFGFGVVQFCRLPKHCDDAVFYVDGLLFLLPDGSHFGVTSAYDLAELREISQLSPEQWIAKDGEAPVSRNQRASSSPTERFRHGDGRKDYAQILVVLPAA
jgi:hypothetical protein